MSSAPPPIDIIFLEAASLGEGSERDEYLNRVCAGDAELRSRVDRLIAAIPKISSFLDTPAFAPSCPPEQIPTAIAADLAGKVIGPYKLLQKLGEGGMGVVYMAEQDLPIRRRVAIKLIRAGLDSSQVAARFEQERVALALMDHPNIARVLDAGITDDDRPYCVMELVKGIPITTYCDQERISIEERIRLFIPVCRAVQHAHQKGVIHRDLKPSNIMVGLYDGVAVPKIIDFGVAKATGLSLTDRTMFTEIGQIIGTLEYMAPEQAEFNNLDIDTRADIYSLGVVLYELLTGSTPLPSRHLRQMGMSEMLRVIKETDAAPPSTRVSTLGNLPRVAADRSLDPARLATLIRGELDWITLKCLEKDRGRRYDSATSLALDLERFLADEPVLACPPSKTYRLKKMFRRNWRAITAAMALLVLMIAGIIGQWIALAAIQRERDEKEISLAAETRASQSARKRLEQLEKANQILGAIFHDLDPVAEDSEGKPLRSLLADRLSAAAEQLQGESIGDPVSVAKMQATLGRSLVGLGLPSKAIELLQQASQTLNDQLGNDNEIAILGWIDLGKAYHDEGNYEKGISILRDVRNRAESVLGKNSKVTLDAMSHLAAALQGADELTEAISLLEEALRRSREVFGPNHPETLSRAGNLGFIYKTAGRHDDSERLLKEAVDACGEERKAGDLDAIAIVSQLSSLYTSQSRFREALPLIEEVLRHRKEQLGPDHPATISAQNNLALAHWSAGRLDLALPMLEDTLRIAQRRFPAGHDGILSSMNNLATAYREAGRTEESIRLHEELLQQVRTRLGSEHFNTIIAMNNLALAYQSANHIAKAIPVFEEAAVAIERRLFEHEYAESTISNLCKALEAEKDPDKLERAESWRRKWIAAVKTLKNTESAEYRRAIRGIGRNLMLQKKWSAAEEALREALELAQQVEPNTSITYDIQLWLGNALLEQEKYAEAEPLLRDGFQGIQGHPTTPAGPDPKQLAEARELIISLYERWGKPEEVAKWRELEP
jgi:eukaryotic-like serine/threonine-protein kinase